MKLLSRIRRRRPPAEPDVDRRLALFREAAVLRRRATRTDRALKEEVALIEGLLQVGVPDDHLMIEAARLRIATWNAVLDDVVARLGEIAIELGGDPAVVAQIIAPKYLWAAKDAARESETPQIEDGDRPTTAPRSEEIVQNDESAEDTDPVSPTLASPLPDSNRRPLPYHGSPTGPAAVTPDAPETEEPATERDTDDGGDPARPASPGDGVENRPTAAPRSGVVATPDPDAGDRLAMAAGIDASYVRVTNVRSDDDAVLDLAPVVRDLGGRIPLADLIAHLSDRPPHRVAASARTLADRGELVLRKYPDRPTIVEVPTEEEADHA